MCVHVRACAQVCVRIRAGRSERAFARIRVSVRALGAHARMRAGARGLPFRFGRTIRGRRNEFECSSYLNVVALEAGEDVHAAVLQAACTRAV